MAETSFLDFLEEEEEDHDFASDDILTVDTVPCWSHIYGPDVLPGQPSDRIGERDRTNQVTFVMDLFHEQVEQSLIEPDLGVIEENREVDVNLGLGTGLGLGFGTENSDEEDCIYLGSGMNNNSSNSLRIVEIGSDPDLEDGFDLPSEGEDYAVDTLDDEDISIPLRWDSLELEDEPNHDFDWEDEDNRVDEMEFLNFMSNDPDEEESLSVLPVFAGSGNLEWEILPYVPNVGTNSWENDDYNPIQDYELLFAQLEDGENPLLSRPPASKSIVENLPSVAITREDVRNDRAFCAICKDQVEVNEEVKKLPCSHWYHGDCILPWLGIRNTCPVCRYELPTDDPDYEQRSRRAVHQIIVTRIAPLDDLI